MSSGTFTYNLTEAFLHSARHTQHGVHIAHLQFTPSWLRRRFKKVRSSCPVFCISPCFILIGCKVESRIKQSLWS